MAAEQGPLLMEWGTSNAHILAQLRVPNVNARAVPGP